MLSKESLSAAVKRAPKVKKLDDPEILEWFGEPVYLRRMAGTDRDSYEEGHFKSSGRDLKLQPTNTRSRLVVRCLCDDSGKRILQDGDVALVGQIDSLILGMIYDAALELNGMGKEADESLLKNSPNGQSAVSGSASPATSA